MDSEDFVLVVECEMFRWSLFAWVEFDNDRRLGR